MEGIKVSMKELRNFEALIIRLYKVYSALGAVKLILPDNFKSNVLAMDKKNR
jgi:hypothetical protein